MNTRWLTFALCFVVCMVACDVCDGADPGSTTGPTAVPRAHDRRVGLVPVPLRNAPQQDDTVALAVSVNDCLAAAYDHSPAVVVWKLNEPQVLAIKDKKGYAFPPIAFSPDGGLLACPSRPDSRVQQDAIFVNIWSVPKGEHVLELPHPRLSEVRSVAFSPKGTMVATACWSLGGMLTPGSDVRLWEYPSGKLMQKFHFGGPVYSIAFSPDETSLALGCGNRLQGYQIPKPCLAVLIDAKNGRERLRPCLKIAF